MPEKQIQPMPWHAEPENGHSVEDPTAWRVCDVNDMPVFKGVTQDEAEFIVRACNHFTNSINALREIQAQCAGHADEFSRRVWLVAQRAVAVVE